MKTYHVICSTGVSALLLATSLPAFAQPAQPAAAAPAAAAARGAARGGRGGGGGGTPLSIIQQLALSRMEVPAALTTAATDALAELNRSTFATPASADAIRTAAQKLAQAELALALARAGEFEKVQATLEKITSAQAQSNAGGGRGGGGGGGRGGNVGTWESTYWDHTGFVSLFDGVSLNGWDGETNVWSVDNGGIHSDNVNRSMGQHHVHYVGPGAVIKDFDLRVEFKIEGGNAGIHYRSRLLSAAHRQDNEAPLGANGTRDPQAALADPLGKFFSADLKTDAAADAAGIPRSGNTSRWQISGYQFDITGNNTASLYEGQGRGVVANAGEMITLNPGGGRTVLRMADLPYQQYGKPDDWNQAQVIARGNTLVHLLNGHVFMVAVDDDPERRAMKGIISLQLEGTGQVWYRNVWLKNLDPAPAAK